MRRERVELSILRHKAAMRGSAVALTARTAGRISAGRTPLNGTLVKNADIEVVVFPVLDALPYDPLNRAFSDSIEVRTKSLEEFSETVKKHIAHGGMISEWGDPVSGIDVKKLRSLRATARGYDPEATDADGDMLVQEGTPWQRLTTRVRRAVKKGKRRLADAADRAADRIDERADRRTSKRGERGKLRERLAGAAERAADRVDAVAERAAGRLDRAAERIDGGDTAPKKPKKKRRGPFRADPLAPDSEYEQQQEWLAERERKKKKPKTWRDVPLTDPEFGSEPAETPDDTDADAPSKPDIVVDEDGKPEPPSPAKPLPDEDDDEWKKAFDEWKKTTGATEDITADTTAESKMPGKKYGTGTKDRDAALIGARDASKKNKDKTLHVVKGTDGKYRVVDDERLEAMGGKPVAAYKGGKIVMRDGAPVKKGKDSTTFKDIDSADGWSGGGKFATEELAVQQASNIKNTVYPDKDFGPDDNIHVVKAEGGMFALVDDEKLQALGVDPVASFNGEGKEIPWGATDPKPKKPKKEKKPKPVGEIPGEEPMPTLEETMPKPEVTADAKKKKPKIGGKQFGRPFKSQKSAIKKADELAAADGGTYHVWGDENGFRVVDQERLDALGVTSLHTGGEKKFKPAPGMKPAEVESGAKKPLSKKEHDRIEGILNDEIIPLVAEGFLPASKWSDEKLAKVKELVDKYMAELDKFETDSSIKPIPSGSAQPPYIVSVETLEKRIQGIADSVNNEMAKRKEKSPSATAEKKTPADLDLDGETEEKTASELAAALAYEMGETHWVVQGDDGLYYAVDEEQYDQLGLEAIQKITKEDAEEIFGEPSKPDGGTKKEAISFDKKKDLDNEILTIGGTNVTNEDEAAKALARLDEIEKELDGYELDSQVGSLQMDVENARKDILKNYPDAGKPKDATPKPTKKSVKEKINSGDIPSAMMLNDTMSGKYSDKELDDAMSVFDKAVAQMEALTPDEREVLGDEYDQIMDGLKNNQKIIQMAKDEGIDIDEATEKFWSGKKKGKKPPKKPIAQDETPVVYNPKTGSMSDMSSVVDKAVGATTNTDQAKEKLKEIEAELRSIAKKMKPAGSKGGPDGPWANYDSDQILTALSEMAMDGDTLAQKRAAEILLNLADDGSLDLTVSGNKKAEQVADAFAAAGKKKISSMSKEKLNEETGIPSPEPGDTSVGALEGFVEKLKAIDVPDTEDTDLDDKINKLWGLKGDVDNYIADLKVELGGNPDDENTKQKIVAAQKMSDEIYGIIEDTAIAQDQIKIQSQEGEYADLMDLMQTLKESYEDSDPLSWSEEKKQFFLKKLGEVEDTLHELDGDSNIYGDEPWEIFSELNEVGVKIVNGPKGDPDGIDLPKPGEKPKQKFGSKQSIEDHYTEEMLKVQQALINGNITKAQADAMKTQLYKDKAKAELDLVPEKVTKDSPKPFKTSKDINEEELASVKTSEELGGFKDAPAVLSEEMGAAKGNLAEYLLTENLINRDLADDPVEVELEDGTKKDVWRPKEGVSDEDIRAAIVASLKEKIEFGADVGEVASLRTHLHNFDVLSKMGAYEGTDLTDAERFGHLGPSAQKGVLKGMYGKLDKDSLDKALGKAAKKKAKKDTAADIAAVKDEPEAPKSAAEPTESLFQSSLAKAKAAGADIWDDLIEAAPEGAILEVVTDVDAEQALLSSGGKPPFKNVDAELIHLDGSKTGYWVNKRFFDGEDDKWLDEKLPTAYKYADSEGDDKLKPGEKGGIVGGPSMGGDWGPDEGTPIFGKTKESFGSAKKIWDDDSIFDYFSHAKMKASYEEKKKIPEQGTEAFEEMASGLRRKHGSSGGVLVTDGTGGIHYVSRQDWKGISDDDKKNYAVLAEIAPVWETWSGEKLEGKTVSSLPEDWSSMPSEDRKKMLSSLFSQGNLVSGYGKADEYQASQLGISDEVIVPPFSDPDGTQLKEQLKGYVSNISEKPDHPYHASKFGFYEVMVGPEGDKKPLIVKINEDKLPMADANPEIFKKVAYYDGAGNYSDDFGDIGADGSKSLLSVLDDPDNFAWADFEGVDTAATLALTQSWFQKLDNKSIDGAKQELSDSDARIASMKTELQEVLKEADLDGFDIGLISEEQMRAAFQESGKDYDAFMTKLKNTSARRQMTKAWLASKLQSENDSTEVITEVKKKFLKNEYKNASEVMLEISKAEKAFDDAEKRMQEVAQRIASPQPGDKVSELLSEYASARAELSAWQRARNEFTLLAESWKDKKYNGKKPVMIGGEEYVPNAGAVFFSDSPDIESATKVASAVSPLLKNEQQIGVFKLDNDKYAVIDMEEALNANMPAPEMIFTSHGKTGPMEADPTDVMDLLTSAGTPKVKEGYAGIENLGVSSDNGIAIGKHVPSSLPPDATPEQIAAEAAKWQDHVANGGSLAEVPNDVLLEVVWNNTGNKGTGRFKPLTKADGFNDMGSDPKMKTHRFLDTATGHAFVIKSASRNDQEGIRELFGNQVMQTLGFPSSGGRTASTVFTAPNKYAEYNHPEARQDVPQVSVLLESSEMLYDGENLGHIRSLSPEQRADVVSRLTPESVANGVVMDSLFRYYDRQEDNWIAIQNPDGSVSYHPIDHGNAFGKFKGKKFRDKDGNTSYDDSQEYEDKLGFMFVGHDGKGVWKLAQQSMNTPERRQRFAEAVLRTVHRAETTDYADEAEKLISAQNLSGELAERVRTSAKLLDDKSQRIGGYVDPMLKEMGMSDDEIAAARQTIQSEIAGGLLKAGKATKPVAAPGQAQSKMVKAEPVPGEEVFGNAPALPGAKTVTDSLAHAAEKEQGISYASIGGGQAKGGVRFTGIDANNGQRQTVMTLRVDEQTASGIVTSLQAGLDASGNDVKVISQGNGVAHLTVEGGKFTSDPTNGSDLAAQSAFTVRDKYQENNHAVVRTAEGHIIIASSGKRESAFSTGDTIQVIMKPKEDGTPHTPDEVHDVLKRVGIKNPAYTADDEWKMQAAELLVRTYDKINSQTLVDPLATRLARVAGNHGLTVNDVEPYFDSVGRMRFRLSDAAWERVKAANPDLADSGTYIVKTMNQYQDESNILRVIESGGVLSKSEQVAGGYGYGGTAIGTGGYGASPGSDLESGGGKGVFMSPFTSTGKHGGSEWGSRGTDIVFDGEEMLRDIGWWAHGPGDGPYGVLNPNSGHMSSVGSYDDPLTTMSKKKTFEFLPDSSADLGKARAVFLTGGNSSQRREKLIKHYRDQGIEEINGIPLEEFFVATPTQAKKAVPKFTGTVMNKMKIASAKAVADEAAGIPQPLVAPGSKPFPSWLIKGYSTDTSYFPDGKLKKTGDLKTAQARAKKYSNAQPGQSFYIFQDDKGYYRVCSEKFYKMRVPSYPAYTEDTMQFRYLAGKQMAGMDPEDVV